MKASRLSYFWGWYIAHKVGRRGIPLYWDVVEVKPLENLSLFVRFADGLAGEVRFTSEHLTGVFTPLNDPAFFKQVYLGRGAVAWPGQIDLAPDAMYQEIKGKGIAVLAYLSGDVSHDKPTNSRWPMAQARGGPLLSCESLVLANAYISIIKKRDYTPGNLAWRS